MTPDEIQEEKRYRTQERLGILTQGAPATAAELEMAVRETDAFIQDLDRQELLERIVVGARAAKRDRELERRFGK